MRMTLQVLWGFSIAVISCGIILGSLALSLAEGGLATLLPTTPSLSPSFMPSQPLNPPTETIWVSPPSSATLTPSPPIVNCLPPAGWQIYIVQQDDTLEGLAERYNIPIEQISQANCLITTSLFPGLSLYIPFVPTFTPVPCGPPADWIRYTILKGDTLYSLAQYYLVSIQQLQKANCMDHSIILYTDRQIYVPPLPTRTLSETPTLSLTPAWTSTFSPTQATVTPSASPTTSDTPTPTATESITQTSSPTVTDTPMQSTITP